VAGEGGLLAQLTKRLVESALKGEITDHLGYDRHHATGRDGGNSRNHRIRTVLTEVRPVEIDVARAVRAEDRRQAQAVPGRRDDAVERVPRAPVRDRRDGDSGGRRP
jgi:Transposase, Mutator family